MQERMTHGRAKTGPRDVRPYGKINKEEERRCYVA